MLWTVTDLAQRLTIKPPTLYAWVAQDKIPCVRLYGLIRFRREESDVWLTGFQRNQVFIPSPRNGSLDLDTLIAVAKRDVYTPGHGETRPRSSLIGKEERDGARETP